MDYEVWAYVRYFAIYPLAFVLLQKVLYFAVTGDWPDWPSASYDCTIGRADIC